MTENAAQPQFELPQELIQQYKDALGRVSSDLRLTVLLLFNAFEEVMKAFAAWRLGCRVSELPRSVANSPSLLFDLVLPDTTAKTLRSRTKLLSELRNDVAHAFHKHTYRPKLDKFVAADPQSLIVGDSHPERVKALRDAVFSLAMDVAIHLSEMPGRGEIPIPILTLELSTDN
jgi:hypothetical protein